MLTGPPALLSASPSGHPRQVVLGSFSWLHGGSGECRLCGSQVAHGAVLAIAEQRHTLFLCRDCAEKVRHNLDGYFYTAIAILGPHNDGTKESGALGANKSVS